MSLHFSFWFSGINRRRRHTPSYAFAEGVALPVTQPVSIEDKDEAGRRHLHNTPYLLPKDGKEIARLDFQHHFLRGVLHRNYVAPLPASTAFILDVGCGTGLWVKEIAREFPMAQVVGVDIDLAMHFNTPANTHFVQGNILTGLPFHAGSFDYVHQRLLVAAIPAARWPFVVRELIRVARPGAWIELLEVGHTFENAGPETRRFMGWWQQISHLNGFDTSLMAQLGGFLRGAALQQVTEQTLRVPVGKWGGHSGELLAKNMHSGFEALKDRYCSQTAVTAEQFDSTLAALPDEWEQYHTVFQFYIAYGQCPPLG